MGWAESELHCVCIDWIMEPGEKERSKSAHNVFFSYSSIVFHCHYLLVCVYTYRFVTNFVSAFFFSDNSFHFILFHHIYIFSSSENRISNNDPFVQIHSNHAHTQNSECIHIALNWCMNSNANGPIFYLSPLENENQPMIRSFFSLNFCFLLLYLSF